MIIALNKYTDSKDFYSAKRAVAALLNILVICGLSLFGLFCIKTHITDTISIRLLPPVIPKNIELIEEVFQKPINVLVNVKKGDTISSILAQQGISGEDALQIVKLTEEHKITKSLNVNQQILFDYDIKIAENEGDELTSEKRQLNKITFVIDKLKSLELVKENNEFVAHTTIAELSKFVTLTSAVINTNLMSALRSLNLSSTNIIDLVNAYSHQIDFQRQIKPGDKISIIMEKFVNKDGKFSHFGNILHASLTLSGTEYNIYRYNPNNNSSGNISQDKIDASVYFSEDGKSVKRNLLRTPVNVVKVSSHYGKRKHPIMGYTKMHKGVDFSAPIGTPIYAAGQGIITEIGFKSGYGRFVQIKHSPTLSTAYAHASRFAKGLKVGSAVKQGQIIAYVGNSGNTTGPHLHYEVKISGKHVNPMSIKTTPGVTLSGKKLAEFKVFKNSIKNLNSELLTKEQQEILIAANSTDKSLINK